MPLITLEVYHDVTEANIARGLLEAAGLLALVFDAGVGGAFAGSTGVRLMVDDADEGVARALLADTTS